jgi:ACS family glucarate transporter-like MFS transporter
MPKRYILILNTFLLSVLLYVDRACIQAAEGPISSDLGFTEKQMGYIFSAFAWGYALCQVPSGWLADRFGPRRILSAVVALWSLFTALTGAAWNFLSMYVFRFLFGVGEAGAFPGMARATFSWIPMKERGIITGINFSGSRIGAAISLVLFAWMFDLIGWRYSFCILGAIGFVWALYWALWFRNDPSQKAGMSREELDYILENRQKQTDRSQVRTLTLGLLLGSTNVWLAMLQYCASNFTFFFCLSWAFKYLKNTYSLSPIEAGIAVGIPLVCGALGNWAAGTLLDRIYMGGHWKLSRQVPAITGFVLATAGLAAFIYMDSIYWAVLFLSIAIFGADMTLSPSWSFCVDIGKEHAGAVSGTMNMAGNIAAAISPIAFAWLNDWTGTYRSYFILAMALNFLAIIIWLFMRPDLPLERD